MSDSSDDGMRGLVGELTLGARRGRKVAGPELLLELDRSLEPKDLATLARPEVVGAGTPTLANIRASHHRLAQLMASGLTNNEVSAITGFSPSRISILKNDPAFKELLESYASVKDAKFSDLMEKLATLGEHAVDELLAKLEERPDDWTKRELMEITELAIKSRAVKNGSTLGMGAPTQGPLVTVQFVKAPETGVVIDGRVEEP